jgi:hypothetical protein
VYVKAHKVTKVKEDQMGLTTETIMAIFRQYHPELIVDDDTGVVLAIVLTIPVDDATKGVDVENQPARAQGF